MLFSNKSLCVCESVLFLFLLLPLTLETGLYANLKRTAAYEILKPACLTATSMPWSEPL